MLYLSKVALVQRMRCCETRNAMEKQMHLGIFVVHDLLLVFVMRYDFTKKKFIWSRLVRLCNMLDEAQLTVALARIRMASKYCWHSLPSKALAVAVNDTLLGLKLKAAAGPPKLRFHHYDSDDEDQDRAVPAVPAKLSDIEFTDMVKEVTGPLQMLQVIQRVRPNKCLVSVHS